MAVTNIQVNADYARYLAFIRGQPTRPPPAVEEPIYPVIPLPAVLQHPTPREPDYLKVIQPVSRAHARYPGPYNHITRRFIVPTQPTTVQTRNVAVRSFLANEEGEGRGEEDDAQEEEATEYTEAETNFSISTEETGTIVLQEESEEGETVVGEESEEEDSTSSEEIESTSSDSSVEFILAIHGHEF